MPGRRVAHFDEYGLVKTISDGGGNTLTFHRTGQKLDSVVHSRGQRIEFENGAQGRIVRVYVPGTTFQVQYAYNSVTMPVGGLSGDGAGGDLVKVTRTTSAGASWRSYAYLPDGHDMTLYSHAALDPAIGQDPNAHTVYYGYTNLPALQLGRPDRRLARSTHVGAERR